LRILAHEALYPEKRCDASAARDRLHAMQTRRRIEHQVTGRQLDRVRSVRIVDDELTAVVVLGFAQK
jgi:hypothetical protein